MLTGSKPKKIIIRQTELTELAIVQGLTRFLKSFIKTVSFDNVEAYAIHHNPPIADRRTFVDLNLKCVFLPIPFKLCLGQKSAREGTGR